MAVPFGFSVGDFLAVGKLIGQVAVELRENGEAAPEYQSLATQLEALKRALHQLWNLKPAKHEFVQLASIQANALACQIPLQNFLAKISKFESRLGAFNAVNNKWKGLPRRMQFRLMFKEDIEQLRSALMIHISTINMLLMTQAVASISAADDDRDCVASGLESKIVAHRQLLEDVHRGLETSMRQRHREIKTQLQDRLSVLEELGEAADGTRQQLASQEAAMQELRAVADRTQEQTNTSLATVTKILALTTSGLMQLRHITGQLRAMIRVCATFTTEMRTAMSKLLALFASLQAMLQQFEHSLPARLCPPIVRFTTALGGAPMALPYELCQRWTTFAELLKVIFLDKPGKARVDMGKYSIMNARGGRLLAERSWQHAVQQDDHLSMSMILDEIPARAGRCPFPRCRAVTEDVQVENGGRTCRVCGRWSLFMPANASSKPLELVNSGRSVMEEAVSGNDPDPLPRSELQNRPIEVARPPEKDEDVDLYRQIQGV